MSGAWPVGNSNASIWALTNAGTQVSIGVYWQAGNSAGHAPHAADLAYSVPAGQTMTVTESDLRAASMFYSPSSNEIHVTDLPAGITESTGGGGQQFTYSAKTAGDTATFVYRAAEVQELNGGWVESNPATVTITVLSGDPLPEPPAFDPLPELPPADTPIPEPPADTPIPEPPADTPIPEPPADTTPPPAATPVVSG